VIAVLAEACPLQ